jgi:hypothetical protein
VAAWIDVRFVGYAARLEEAIHLVSGSNTQHLASLVHRQLAGPHAFDGKRFGRRASKAARRARELPSDLFGNVEMDLHTESFCKYYRPGRDREETLRQARCEAWGSQ